MRTFAKLILCLTLPTIALAQTTAPPRDVQEHEPEPTTGVDTGAASSPAADRATTPLNELIARDPAHVTGQTLVLVEGALTKAVGPVLAVRKQRNDQRLYLIVDGTAFAGSPKQYAVPVNDLDYVEKDRLIMRAASDMQLPGIEYDADDYEDLPTPAAPPLKD